jgi:signal transduction histidine kinase
MAEQRLEDPAGAAGAAERYHLLRGAAILVGLVSLASIPFFMADPHIPILLIAGALLSFATCVVGLWLAQRGWLQAGGYLISLVLMLVISTLPPEKLLDGPHGSAFVVGVAIAGVVGGATAMLAMGGLALALLGAACVWYETFSVSTMTTIFTVVMTTGIFAMILSTLERALRQAHAHAQTMLLLEQERYQRMFISFFHHELRSHAASMTGLVRTARYVQPGCDPAQTGWSDRVLPLLEARAEQLTEMMQQLSVLLRSDVRPAAGQLVALDAIVQAAQRAARDLAQLHHLQLTIEVAVDAAAVIEAIPGYVQMAVDTLLRNAVEASLRADRRTLRIALSAAAAADGIELVIADDGPGFPQVVLDQMADAGPIAMVTSAKRERGVSGLGLPLVNQVMQLHRGRLRIANCQPHGAWVALRFPSAAGRTERAAPSQATSPAIK